ncbi:MAG: hypothetical protein ACRDI2_20815, partial [Chloroflexota bacterium]
MPLRPLCRSTIPSSSSSFTVAAAAAAALRTPRRGFLRQALAGAGVTLGSGLALPFRTAFANQHSAAALVPDWDVPGGHFYTQTAPEGAPSDTGYVVSNADEVEFWRRYQALGGPAELGYPVSSRYEAGGTIYQVMQAGVLRWNPTAGGVEVHPAMVALAELEMDGWLEAWGIPRTSPDLLKDPALPAETRLGWLTHPALEAAYLQSDEAAARQRFGLPMGGPARFGPYMAQR